MFRDILLEKFLWLALRAEFLAELVDEPIGAAAEDAVDTVGLARRLVPIRVARRDDLGEPPPCCPPSCVPQAASSVRRATLVWERLHSCCSSTVSSSQPSGLSSIPASTRTSCSGKAAIPPTFGDVEIPDHDEGRGVWCTLYFSKLCLNPVLDSLENSWTKVKIVNVQMVDFARA